MSQAAEEKYNKSKMVHSIMRHVAETTGQDLEQLYKQIAWPMYKMYGHAFEAFKNMVQDPEPVFAKLQVYLAEIKLCKLLFHVPDSFSAEWCSMLYSFW